MHDFADGRKVFNKQTKQKFKQISRTILVSIGKVLQFVGSHP